MPVLKKTPAKTAEPSRLQQANEKIAKAQADPFAAKYAETEASTGGGYVPPPPGAYEAIIVEAQGVREDAPSKKEYAFLEMALVNCEDEDLNGKKIRLFYNFKKEDGSEGEGWSYFKAANEMLGGTPPTSWDDMCDTLAEIAKAEIWVHINVVKKGKYSNAYLQDVPEDQDSKPATPE